VTRLQGIVFDLGSTLVDWPDWDSDIERRWAKSWDYLVAEQPSMAWPSQASYVRAMRRAELEHWNRVNGELTSDPPERVLSDGFRYMGVEVSEPALLIALDGYARAVDGWAVAYPDARPTLQCLRGAGYRLAILSNTWWAASWHNADLAAQELTDLFDHVLYTSELGYSKPHPAVFQEASHRLGLDPTACVMVGDRLRDDIGGALSVGMRAVWKRTDKAWAQPDQRPKDVEPTATIDALAELLPLIESWTRD
jgi:putative hydrolase of the HAD superfamily